eukprot:CAMPEP_0184856478 /NCGR_PEP_ID=MMETSP0580-20130426/1659_1 /TAXON_ID=1118495 /ORGANISM="Dactyliosolen fragilissimus" /LENGTH=362 /DNA_ID=CAMNT_0027351537 /DNA_START=38 /DNA_END=1126 /DNA_ORIENTATION=+
MALFLPPFSSKVATTKNNLLNCSKAWQRFVMIKNQQQRNKIQGTTSRALTCNNQIMTNHYNIFLNYKHNHIKGITINNNNNNNNNNNMISIQRGFSSESTCKLSELLEREMEEEKNENGNDDDKFGANASLSMPEELLDLKDIISKNWRIVDNEFSIPSSAGSIESVSSGTVKLFKTEALPNGGKVCITFHCQDTIEEHEHDDEEEESLMENMFGSAITTKSTDNTDSNNKEEEDEEEISTPIRFFLDITRAGKTMRASCISDQAEAFVQGVVIFSADGSSGTTTSTATDHESLRGPTGDSYQGPQFDELAEDLQEEFTNYIRQDCGVNEDLATFISMYADHKEQIQYMKWLKQVHGIIKLH